MILLYQNEITLNGFDKDIIEKLLEEKKLTMLGSKSGRPEIMKLRVLSDKDFYLAFINKEKFKHLIGVHNNGAYAVCISSIEDIINNFLCFGVSQLGYPFPTGLIYQGTVFDLRGKLRFIAASEGDLFICFKEL